MSQVEQGRLNEPVALRRLIETVEAFQHARSIDEAAAAIVEGGQRFGFQRIRLWWLSDDGRSAFGLRQEGNAGLDNFAGLFMRVEHSPYFRRVLASDQPLVFNDEEIGPTFLTRAVAPQGYQPPVGPWVTMLLRTPGRPLGVLSMDSPHDPSLLAPERRPLLHLFGRQAAATLDRARATYERDWLVVLTEVAEQAQRAQTLPEVGDILVNGGIKLGFERARLFLPTDAANDVLVGLSQAGDESLAHFHKLQIQIASSPYMVTAIDSQEPVYFIGRPYGPAPVDVGFGQQGFRPPVGEWVSIALRSGPTLLGLLVMDNAHQERRLNQAHKDLLHLFGRQAAAALDRARATYERNWLVVLTDVAKRAQGAQTEQALGRIIVKGGRRLGFERARLWRCDWEARRLVGLSQAGAARLEPFVEYSLPMDQYGARAFSGREPLFFMGREHGGAPIDHHIEAPIGEWVAVPIWVGTTCRAMLSLDNAHQERRLSPQQKSLLRLFARQVEAALARVLASVDQQKTYQRLAVVRTVIDVIKDQIELSAMFTKIRDALRGLFDSPTDSFVLMYEANEHHLQRRDEFFAPGYYQITNPAYHDLQALPLGPAAQPRSVAARLAGQALAKREVVSENIRDVSADPDYLDLHVRTRSLLCVSLMSSANELLGILSLESERPAAFDHDDESLLNLVGREISIAIDRARLSEQLSYKTTLAANVTWAADIAHDINKEIGRIREQVLRLRLETTLSDRAQQALTVIDRSADNLRLTVRDARDEHSADLQTTVIDERLRQLLEQRDFATGITIAYALGCPGVKVAIISTFFQRVLRHLLRNAEAALEGRGTVTVRTQRASAALILTVENNGPPIPRVIQDTIFLGLPPAPRRSHGGLGLLMTRLYLERMHGTIRLKRSSEAGTIFEITLPIKEEEV